MHEAYLKSVHEHAQEGSARRVCEPLEAIRGIWASETISQIV